MKKHLQILMAGALIVVPLGVTAMIIGWVGEKLADLGQWLLNATGLIKQVSPTYIDYAPWGGVLLGLAALYLIGLLANLWIFKKGFKLMDHIIGKLPGIKTIYESVRDLMKLFGGDSGKMGYAVLYKPDGSHVRQLGIVTNENPAGRAEGDDSVIVYLPMGYMIGGPIVYASPADLERLDMPVETALKLAATAFISVGDKATPALPNENKSLPG
ncbi:MAG: DUF502 domain-containing protein [Phycisphaerae bacterium]|nr:DUF502 domain-containing protein [Phycisphaerae bacterium]